MEKNKNEFLLLVFFISAIIPFLILHFFNHPTPEDLVWTEETSKYGFFNAQEFFYRVWSGRFFSYALLSINPLIVYSIMGYRILLLLLMTGFIFVLYLLISEAVQSSITRKEKFLVTVSIVFLYLFGMSSISQGFYWLTSVFIYHLGLMLIMLFFIFYLREKKTQEKSKKFFLTFLNGVILLAVCGTNELTSITIFLILILILIGGIVNKRTDPALVVFLLILSAGAIFSLMSPGNASRAERSNLDFNFMYAIQFSIIFIAQKIISWLIFTPIIPVSIIMLPVLSKIKFTDQQKTETSLFKVVIVLACLLILIFILVLISFLSTGESLYGRALNFIYFVFLAGWFIFIYGLIPYLKKFNLSIRIFPNYVYVIFFLLILILFIFTKNNLRNSYSELFRGRADEYSYKLNARYEYLKESGDADCEVDSIKNVPKTFFLYDITSDTANYYNKWYAQYFKKNTIRLRKNENR